MAETSSNHGVSLVTRVRAWPQALRAWLRLPSTPESVFYLIDPPSDMKRAIFELDPVGLAAAEKFDGILVDERYVPQIQNQLPPGYLDGEHLLKLLYILCCFDPAAECEQDLTVRCSPSSQHASSLRCSEPSHCRLRIR
jgi:hypothetical protein